MEHDKLISEARARIIWGESPSSVRYFLTSNGLSDMDADATITEFNGERNAEIRKIGIKNTFMGVALIGGVGIFFYLCLRYPSPAESGSGLKGYGGAMFVGFYGIWKLVNGIIRLVRPQSENESITEIFE